MATVDITITGQSGSKTHSYTLETSEVGASALIKAIETALIDLGARYTFNHLVRLSDGATVIEISAAPGRINPTLCPEAPWKSRPAVSSATA